MLGTKTNSRISMLDTWRNILSTMLTPFGLFDAGRVEGSDGIGASISSPKVGSPVGWNCP